MSVLTALAVLFLVLPAVVTFAVPVRYFGFFAVWVAMLLIVGIAMPPTGPDHSSPFSGMGDPLYFLICMFIGGLIAVRGIVILIKRQVPLTPAPLARVAWTVTGALAAFCTIAIISLPSGAARPAWAAHAPAVVIAIGALVLLFANRWVMHVPQRCFAIGAAASAIATVAGAGGWIVYRVNAVIDAAERVAGDRSYCMQVVAIRPEFAEARARIDFSPLTMRADCRGGWCWQNHAILVVDDGGERRLMNWSYRRIEFRDEVLNVRTKPPAVRCTPKPHFARDLPLL